MNWRGISRNVGNALLVSALFMFLSMLVSISRGNDSALAALMISFILTFIVGIFPFIFVKKSSKITLGEGYLTIFLAWLLSFIFGMLPYALWGGPFTIVNAWFESVSGYTTTGSTILSNVEALPDSLLFWRSSTHFIGGLGVVVFILLIIPESAPVRLRLSSMEFSSLSRSSFHVRTNKTGMIFAQVYLVMNLVAFLLYWMAGMSPFDAINHAFSVCSTGGFSTKNISIAAFDSLPITLITMFFMLAASVHFGMLFMVFATRSLKPLKNSVLKLYLSYIALFSLITAIVLKSENIVSSWGRALLDGSFQMLSYASTTGLAIADNKDWPYFLSLLLMAAGTVCGMAGSTTGGIKSDRLLLLIKSVKGQVLSALNPSSVTEVKFAGKNISQKDTYSHILYIAVFCALWIISTILVLMFHGSQSNALMSTLSSLGNVGPSVAELGTFGNYGGEATMAKVIYTMDMFLGRVEIFPILSVYYMIFGSEGRH